MERLTRNLYPIYVLTEEMEKEYIDEKIKKLTNKLGRYEDLEEELKLGLDIFAKIVMQGYLYYKKGRKIELETFTTYDKREKAFVSYYIASGQLQDGEHFYLEDYGKKWAATEQELGGKV